MRNYRLAWAKDAHAVGCGQYHRATLIFERLTTLSALVFRHLPDPEVERYRMNELMQRSSPVRVVKALEQLLLSHS